MSGRVRAFASGTRALVGLMVAAGLALAPPAAASPAPVDALVHRALPAATDYTDGLRVEAGTTFTVDLDAPAVHVSHVATLTNTTPNRVSGGYVTEYYFATYAVPVVPGATNLRATRSDGRVLSVSLREEDGYLPAAMIRLSPRLTYRQSQKVELTYDLPPQAPRSDAMAQVNAAYASFPVFVSADPGLGSASVVLPKDADHEFVGPALDCTDGGATLVCATTDLADPEAWYTLVVARQDDALVARTLTVGDEEIRIQAWPGDAAVARSDLRHRRAGAPRAQGARRTGLDRPTAARHRRDVDAVPVRLRRLVPAGAVAHRDRRRPGPDGHAARALPRLVQRPEVQRPLDRRGARRTSTRPWRWTRSVRSTTHRSRWTSPRPSQYPSSTGRRPRPPTRTPRPAKTWGYNTAWWVEHALVDEIGRDRMVAVVQAAIDEDMPYPAPTIEEGTHTVADWRAFLDLAEEVGGSTEAEQLFRDYVVGPAGQDLLDARAEARQAYAELLDAGDGWAPPSTLRRSMTTWSFDDAMAMMPQVTDLLDRREAVAAELDTIGEPVPTSLERQFESSNDLDHLALLMDSATSASTALVEASTARADASALTRAGLLVGGHVDTDLATARAAMDDGDWDAARTAADGASAGLDRASLYGTVAVLVLVLLLAAAGVVVVLHRRRGSDARPAQEDAQPAPEEVAS